MSSNIDYDKLTQAQADLLEIRRTVRERNDIDFGIGYPVSVLVNAVEEVNDSIADAIRDHDSLAEDSSNG